MLLADPSTIARETLADIYPPRDRVSVDAWCEAHRIMATTGAAGARSGRWDTSLTPYLRQPLRNLTDPKITEIAVLKSSQIGYSEFLINGALYLMGEQRRPGLIGYPTYDEAKDFNAKRLIPALRACPKTADMVRSARDITEAEIKLGGVPLWFAWAHSTKTFKSDPVAVIWLDEIDEYPAGGEVLSNARDRQRTFDDRKLIKGSTPEDAEAEGFITQEYTAAQHRYRFMVPCPITGEFFELHDFGLLRWPGGETANPDDAARRCWLQSPKVFVPRHRIGDTTEGRIDERHKAWMVRHGIWVRQGEEIEVTDEWKNRVLADSPADAGGDTPPWLSAVDADFLREAPRGGRFSRVLAARRPDAATARAAQLVRIVGGEDGAAGRIPSASTVGYRINALASLIDAQGWGGIVRKGLTERFGAAFQKGTLGQAPSVKGDIASIRHLKDRCRPTDEGGYALGTVPPGVGFVAAGVDIQKYCVYAAAIGFGDEHTDPAIIDARRIARDERMGLRDIEDDLAAWSFAIGQTALRPGFLGIDAGFWMGDVHNLVERLRGRGVAAWNARGESGQQTQQLYRLRKVPEKDEYGNETGRTHDTLYFHTDRWMTQLYGLLTDGREDTHDPEADAIAAMGARPRVMRMPAPWAFDDGRVSGDWIDFLKQITAERRVTKTQGVRVIQRWEPKREGLPNHYGDCCRIAIAGAHFRGVELLTAEAVERIRARAERRAPAAEPVKARTTARPRTADPPRRVPRQSPGTIVSRLYG